VLQSEAEAAAGLELRGKTKSLDDELAELGGSSSNIDDELARLKARLNKDKE